MIMIHLDSNGPVMSKMKRHSEVVFGVLLSPFLLNTTKLCESKVGWDEGLLEEQNHLNYGLMNSTPPLICCLDVTEPS